MIRFEDFKEIRGPIRAKSLDIECLDELPMLRVPAGQLPVQNCGHMSVLDDDVCRPEVTVREDYGVFVATKHTTNERTNMTAGFCHVSFCDCGLEVVFAVEWALGMC